MYKVEPHPIGEIVGRMVRDAGLETPLLQRRLLAAWDSVVGDYVAAHTVNKSIKNQTLFVEIHSPALRQELLLRRARIVAALNKSVNAFLITDIRIY